ncbi:FkbM family methyltransferase [Flavisolibacter sp. BT320]|nr:FkbM family methyltransferase [Flavisolibacter longurius]
MNKFISFLFGLLPETAFKHHLRCFFYNRLQKNFKIHYNAGLYLVQYNGHTLKFTHNPYHLLMRDRDYSYKYNLQEGDSVVDAGAFYGVFTVFAAKTVGERGKVIALEPDLDNYKIVERHIALNQLNNVVLLGKGLWSTEGELHFASGKELGSTFIVDHDEPTQTTSIPVTTIDTIFQGIPVIKNIFIKMNIEGSEIEAVKGARQTITKYQPRFAIRTNHYVDGFYTDSRIEQELHNYGYRTESTVLSELSTFGWPEH